MRRIVMSFDAFGNTSVDAQNFAGSSCEDATKLYLEKLNAGSEDSEKKPEWGNTESVGQAVGQRW